MNSLRVLISTLLVAAFAAPLSAIDTITRRDGTNVSGEIQTATKTEITLKQGARSETVAVNDVARVSWNGEPLTFKNARGLDDNGDLVKAGEFYAQTLTSPGSMSDLGKKDARYLAARVKAQAALVDSSQADAAIKDLEAQKSSMGDFFRYYELHEYLGKAYAAKGDFDKAREAFSELASAPFNDFKMRGQILTANALLAADDVAGAEQEFAAVAGAQATTPQEIEQKNLGRLGQAGCMTRQGKPAEAVALLDAVIDESGKSQAPVQARAFLLKGNAMQALDKPQQAIMAYLGVDLLFENQPELHAEALFHLSKLWNDVSNEERAKNAAARLKAKYPQSRWLSQLN